MGNDCPTTLAADGSNYVTWWNDIGDYLRTKKLAAYLTTPAPAGRTAQQALEEDQEALGHLRLSCSTAVKHQLSIYNSTADAVQYLRTHFRSASEAKLLMLECEKSRLRKLEDETVSEYIQRARDLAANIAAAGGRCADADIRSPILNGLPQDYETSVELAEHMNDKSLAALERLLREKEQRLKMRAGVGASGLVGFVAPRNPHSSSGPAGPSGSGGDDNSCRYCFCAGHYARDCRVRLADERSRIFRRNINAPPTNGGGGGGGNSGRGSNGGTNGNNGGGRGGGAPRGKCNRRGRGGGGGSGAAAADPRQNRATVLTVRAAVEDAGCAAGSSEHCASTSCAAGQPHDAGCDAGSSAHRASTGCAAGQLQDVGCAAGSSNSSASTGCAAGPSSTTNPAVCTVSGGPGAADPELLLDSGAFCHLTGDFTLLHSYVPSCSVGRVVWGDGRPAAAEGSGELHMRTTTGRKVIVPDVQYVPSTTLTLLSVSKLLNSGSQVVFARNAVHVSRGNKVVLEGKNSRGAFVLDVQLERTAAVAPAVAVSQAALPVAPVAGSTANCSAVSGTTSDAGGSSAAGSSADGSGVDGSGVGGCGVGGSSTGGSVAGSSAAGNSVCSAEALAAAQHLHRLYGHLSYGALQTLARDDLVLGLNVSIAALQRAAKDVCGVCVQAKAAASPSSRLSRPQHALQLVHSDLCGPMPVTGRGGVRYFLTLLDGATGLSLVRLLPTKDQVAAALQDMVAQLEARHPHQATVRALHSDNGGEYIAEALQQWLQQRSIAHTFSAPYTPQQNGVAERLNRTLMDRVRALLQEADLPPSFWPDAVLFASCLRNVSPSQGRAVTPWEAFHGAKPDISGLHVFGCRAYAHVPISQLQKLSSRAELGTYLGPDRSSSSARILVGGSVTVCRDATFDDSVRGPASRRAGTAFSGAGGAGSHLVDTAAAPSGGGASGSGSASGGGGGGPEAPRRPVTRSQHQPLTPPLAPVRSDHRGGGGESQDTPPLSSSSGLTEPRSFEEAVSGPNEAEWRRAMDDEIASQLTNGTWELAEPPPGARILSCRWVYKVKLNPDGSIERFKARLVVRGFEQRAGIDYGELFAPTTRAASLRALLALVAAAGLQLHQMDVKTAFLNGDLEEELWMQQPPGYSNDSASQACRLRKALYGLKQAPRCWYEKLAAALQEHGFEPSASDPALFVKRGPDGLTFLLVHVDDLLLAAATAALIAAAKAAVASCFAVRDLGEASVYLGMDIVRDRRSGSITLSQRRYVEQLLERHGLTDAKPRSTPVPLGTRLLPADESQPPMADGGSYRALVGELNYVATCTRPDIAQALSMLARHMAAPTKTHMGLALGVLRYLSGTRELGLRFGGGDSKAAAASVAGFSGYSDADWAGDPATRRSTTGYVFMLGGAAVSWSSQLQRTVAASSVEAEYQAAAAAVREALWLRKLAADLGLARNTVGILLDSQGALSLVHNPITSVRSKHIDVHHHLVRERAARGEVTLGYCATEDMVADILTKALGENKFRRCRTAMGVV